MKNQDQIIDLLNSLDTNELIQVNNSFAIENNYDSEVYMNDEEFFELYFPKSIDAVRAAFYGDYNYLHYYVRINGYGNLESLNYFEVSDLCDTVENIAEHIAENEELYSFLDLSDIDEEDDED